MSKIFIENGQEGSKNLFNKKQLYKIVSRSNMKNLIDFNFGEKRLYGRVDKYFQPVIPNENYFKLVELKAGTPEAVKVFDFVADAFADLQNKFKIKVVRSEISADEKFLTDIIPVAAYEDPKQIFQKYTDSFIMAVENIIIDNNLRFMNFDQFINVLMPYIENFLKDNTLPFPAYVKSKSCPMNVSGLVIEIADIEPNDDAEKYKSFYKSKNWEFFLNACNTYGFMVDCNMPNKIIADINSAPMMQKMAAYAPEINSGSKFMANCYNHAAFDYYLTFKGFLYTLYSSNRPRTIVTTVNNSYDGTRSIITKAKSYTYSTFVDEIGEQKLLNLYMKIRFIEEESQFSEYEKKVIMRDTLQVVGIDGILNAILVFELLLNKTFDYSGSLSYIQKRREDLRK